MSEKLYNPNLSAAEARELEELGKPKVISPGADELAAAMAAGTVCGECKYFSLAEGQTLMRAQRFVERLVKEHNWQTHHLCSPVNQLGLCGQTVSGQGGDDVTITGRLHKACDHFRPSNGLVTITRKTTDPR